MDRSVAESRYLDAARRAVALFPVAAETIRLVAHSENITFRVSARNSDSDYALRLHRPDYNSLRELESERAWLAALREAGIGVQDSLRTRRGRCFGAIDMPASGEQRFAGMTTWMEGRSLDDYLETCSSPSERAHVFRRIGMIAAAIHNQSANWEEPPGFERRRLDIDGLLGDTPLWGRFWEHESLTAAERALLLRARDQLRGMLDDYGSPPGIFGLIHADLHPANFVYDGKDLSLIDFDDSGYGWHMYDIASALIEVRRAPDFEQLRDALLEGYRGSRPLASRDAGLLPTFLLIRGMAIMGWFHQRPEHAGSSYFRQVKDMVLGKCKELLGRPASAVGR